MPGYDYELVVRDGPAERRFAYWSAFRLQPGSKVLAGGLLAVVEETVTSVQPDAPAVAVCRPARPDEGFD